MSRPDDALRRIDALVQVAMRLAATAPSGRIALAKVAAAVERDWIPRGWQHTVWPELESARRAAAEPLPAAAVERVLREAWGVGPTEELDDLDPEPVAVTPTSQVHRATLEGRAVAVKVLRPGLAAGVRQDLALLESLVGPLAGAFPGVDPAALLRETRERVLDELDLEHEAGMQRRFHRALRGHPDLVVPAPITRLADENVVVSEWIEGVPLAEAADADRAAEKLVLFVLGGIRAGMVHADPDPADVLELDDGRLAVLDYGATRTVSGERADAALAVVEAFAAEDPVAFGSALQRLGALDAEHADTALELVRHALAEHGRPGATRLDRAAVVDVGRRAGERPHEAIQVLTAGSLPPEDLWPLRAAGLLFGTIARVGATGRWLELTLAALREGWEARI